MVNGVSIWDAAFAYLGVLAGFCCFFYVANRVNQGVDHYGPWPLFRAIWALTRAWKQKWEKIANIFTLDMGNSVNLWYPHQPIATVGFRIFRQTTLRSIYVPGFEK